MLPSALSITGQNSSRIANVVIGPTRPFDQNTFMSPPAAGTHPRRGMCFRPYVFVYFEFSETGLPPHGAGLRSRVQATLELPAHDFRMLAALIDLSS
jgi:hypothetical protein